MRLSAPLFFVVLTLSTNAFASGFEGLWLTENKRAAVEITSCQEGQSLCGKIAWIIEDGMQLDEKNEDPALRSNKLCGMQILYGFNKGKTDGEWNDGKIYKADDGDVYNASIKQIDDNRLRIRGYIGIPLFGKTQMWTRAPNAHPRCG